MSMRLESTAFTHKGEIPARYCCDGEDISPPLNWMGVPEKARSLVLIIDDPDAPDPRAPKMVWVHWVLYNIPVEISALNEGVTAAALSPGTAQGLNDWKRTAYGGPCPPVGRHRYFHKLYALDRRLDLQGSPVKSEVESAMKGHILAYAELVGSYQKPS